jgi:2-polyprenyl-3-methyl-5-hydroxy-6-metoxy-1,4-benzoquinol methylase
MPLSAYQQVQQVKDHYNLIGEHFSETRKKRMWAEILPFTKLVKNEMKVLDVGCGNGRLVPEFKGRKVKYLGIDFSQSLIDQAKLRFPSRRFLNRDITSSTDWDRIGEYDAVFCLGVLHHIPDRKRQHEVLQQLYAHTKPGGFVVISVWNLWQLRFLKLHLLQLKKKADYGNFSYLWVPYKVSDGVKNIRTVKRFCKAYLPGELLGLVKQVGYKIDTYYYAINGETHKSIFKGQNFCLLAYRRA